ncbi:hypothetical protein DSO57_1001182 [Entomophthora muscae]|uniref:Uncharacterized protein n=1 Tax=Entomophthora muscae TaxID=34485 RepID=A0ACC2TW37_9FUNG|nr:hypothetical protein DSO57_1001182 [Entomophthora muscae]
MLEKIHTKRRASAPPAVADFVKCRFPLFKRQSNNAKEMFKDIKVQTVTGETMLLSDLWKERPVVLKVLARLGCAMCKQEALTLREMKPLLDKHNVAIAAVAFEDLDLKNFLTGGYWGWDILLDPERKVYEAAGLWRMTPMQFMRDIFSGRLFKIMSVLLWRGIMNPVRGDPRQLGGTFVINTDGAIAYSFKASRLAMFPSAKEIYATIGGDPDEVEEDVPTSYIYSQLKASSAMAKI